MVFLNQCDLIPLPPSSNTSGQCLKAVAKALDIPAQSSSAAAVHEFLAGLCLYSPFLETEVLKVSTQTHTCYPRPEAHFDDPVNTF